MSANPKKAKLLARRPLNADTFLLAFEASEELDFIGGQYIILNTGAKGLDGADVKRAYSLLSRDNEQRRFEIAVKAISGGLASEQLAGLEPGAELLFSGPWGKFIKNALWPREGSTLVVVTDTAITLALGLMSSRKFSPLWPKLQVLWLVSDTSYFLPFEVVNHRVPDEFNDFHIVSISSVEDPGRVAESVAAVEQKLMQAGVPENAFLAGDGNVVRELQGLLVRRGAGADWIGTETFFNKEKKEDSPKEIPPGFVKSGTTGKIVAIKDLREGFTTGACSAAAAKAATRVLLTGRALEAVETTLPNRNRVKFALKRCEWGPDFAVCSVIKDAGDDPDATHGAELTACVRWVPGEEIVLRGGAGVATVTKAGLGLEVGGAAINPVPRKNITEMVAEELIASPRKGVEVTISVPGGPEMAKKTLNERLGLVGGISILGTTGIVKPYSTAAYRASVVQAIQLAREQGEDTVVLTTGGKSEKYAMVLFPKLDPVCFIQVGDFIGAAIKATARSGIARAVIVGMIGKLSKMADGRMMTHAAGSDVNIAMLARIAREVGVPEAVCAEIEKAVTARGVLELCQKAGFPQITGAICEKVVSVLGSYAGPSVRVSAYLVDFDGKLTGSYPEDAQRGEVVSSGSFANASGPDERIARKEEIQRE